ncbi:hypothetical protein [Clostridium sp. YIM B02555]|uniref:hypothetical protein n=1 Tax=Clostridium sp. YIM B02555 TaxID=2911968 RepID=UPI001EEDE4B3|nr:hypothetical protein [Clostridium sp. YIM B02555]
MMPTKSKLISRLIIYSLIILIMPIVAIQADFIKNIVLWLFKNKTNAHEYLQFSGAFLGVIGAVGGTALLIDKEKNYKIGTR